MLGGASCLPRTCYRIASTISIAPIYQVHFARFPLRSGLFYLGFPMKLTFNQEAQLEFNKIKDAIDLIVYPAIKDNLVMPYPCQGNSNLLETTKRLNVIFYKETSYKRLCEEIIARIKNIPYKITCLNPPSKEPFLYERHQIGDLNYILSMAICFIEPETYFNFDIYYIEEN